MRVVFMIYIDTRGARSARLHVMFMICIDTRGARGAHDMIDMHERMTYRIFATARFRFN